jgi:hypothetical protein
MRGEKKLGEILVDLRVLTEREVEEVVVALRRRRDNVKFGEMARALGLVREEHILAALAVQLRLFPGIQDLSMKRLLDTLQQPTELVTKEVVVPSPV